MLKSNAMIKIDNYQFVYSYHEPDICPSCKYAIQPQELSAVGYLDSADAKNIAITYLCKNCYRPFLAHYNFSGDKQHNGYPLAVTLSVEPNRFSPEKFDACIETLSPSFVTIYNQSLAAESSGLDQIAGVGYRKALEFLIKDFLISQTPDQKETIERMELGNVIANKISNDKLKAVASRSAWLGNDQTHYVQKFTDYDIQDMKRFISAAVYWISAELITQEALEIEPRGH